MPAPLRLAFAGDGQDRAKLCIDVHAGSRKLGRIWFRTRTGTLRPDPNALLCLGLYPAAECGAELAISGAVDADLLARAPRINGMFKTWWNCRQIGIHAAPAPPRTVEGGRGMAAFFSGGIDSSFTLAGAGPRLSALITIVGVDVPLSDATRVAQLARLCEDTAAFYGLEPVVIETNLNDVLHPYASWIHLHGAAMASIGHMLAHRFERVLIASSGNETAWNVPWGSHPGLDPLFGSAALQIEHHGLVSRYDKIARLATHDLLLRNLRVCNKAGYNCGICDKCTFAMRALAILGISARAPGFPPNDLTKGGYRIVDDAFLSEMQRLRAAALAANHPEMIPEIDQAMARYRRRIARWLPGLTRVHNRMRIMKHRLRYNRIAA